MIEVRDVLGTRFDMSPSLLISLFRQSATQMYLGLAFILLVVTDAPGLYGTVSLGTLLGIWALVLVTFHLCVYVLLHGLVWLAERGVRPVIYRSMLFLTALFPSIYMGEWLTELSTFGRDPIDPLLGKFIVYGIIAEAFGIMYFKLIHPQKVPDAAPTLAERNVVIGAEPVALSLLRVIEAREHHVHVMMDSDSLTQRARLSDIVAQTRPEDGLQPHRSFWVAARVARGLEREGNKHLLRLDDGSVVPVARSRLTEVRNWLEAHG